MERLSLARSKSWDGRVSVGTIVVIVGVLLMILLSIFVVYPAIRTSTVRKLFQEARMREETGNGEEAAAIYEKIIADFPDMREAGLSESKLKQLRQMLATAARLKRDADNAFREKRFEDALALYQEIVEKYPQSRRAKEANTSIPGCAQMATQALMVEVQKAEGEGRWDDARNLLGRIHAIDPEYVEINEKIDAAQKKLDAFAEYKRNAATAEQAGLMEDALESLEAALAILPHDEQTYADRIRVLKVIPPPEGMVLILPGEFIAGSDDGDRDERPRRTLKTNGFYMDRTEVTNAQYARFVSETGRTPPLYWGGNAPDDTIADLPVVAVTWADADAYAKWCGKRLPTAMEWERAARGIIPGKEYPWGDTFDVASGIFSMGPAPVGISAADKSPEGCMDMAGNVSEWTATDGRLESKEIRGASWAGVERDRPNPIVPMRPGTDYAMNTIILDNGEMLSLIIRGSETDFSPTTIQSGIVTFQIRKWVSAKNHYVTASFPIRPGEPIRGERLLKAEEGLGPAGKKSAFETGCTLLRINHPDEPERLSITFVNQAGVERSMKIRPEATLKSTIPPLGAQSEESVKNWTKSLRERTLAKVARSANRLYASPEGRFANCGFRCAKDVR